MTADAAGSAPGPRDVWIVPHTHWDREWYSGFQTFRLRLVELLDGLLDELDRDPAYAHFMLDGQMAVVDDYLAMRPHNEERLRRLAAEGRLGVGPWSILMDEFLVSGETIVRNLRSGLERAAGFGGAMEVGYLPDMFGHVAQMPQILAQFGFEHAVVWRGVPSAVDRSGFWWSAPDGSEVRAEYLPDGYGNGAATPDDAKALVRRIQRFERHWDGLLVGPILWMNGTDHQVPQPWLGRVVAEANDIQDDYRLRVAPLAEYLRHAATEGLPSWQGELRSGARANLLMGVASNRVDVKQAAAAAERQLERVAEPLVTLFESPGAWPEAELAEAWAQLIRNSAHDSSCACSIDEVCDAVLVRYEQARQIGHGLARRAARSLARQMASPGEVVINPTQRPRSAVVELVLRGHDDLPGIQVRQRRGGSSAPEPMTVAAALEVARLALGGDEAVTGAELRTGGEAALEICLHRTGAQASADALDADAALDELERLGDTLDPDAPATLATATPHRQVVLAHVDEVPGFGWQRWEPAPLRPEPVSVEQTSTGEIRLGNGILDIAADPVDGTFSINGTPGFGRLVDDGDVGDTYNWCPPDQDTVLDRPSHVDLFVEFAGPLRAQVVINRLYEWPVMAEGTQRRSDQTETVAVRTTLRLDAGARALGVNVRLDNRCCDHRLRAWLPLPSAASHATAECAFGTTTRGLAAEGGPTEAAVNTQPMRRFVCAGGLTVVTDGLLEHELVDLDGDPSDPATRAGALALTLLRCTGLLSQRPMATRPLPAGPVVPTPGAQMTGPQELRFAVAVGDDTEAAYEIADEVLTPLEVVRSPGAGWMGDEGSALEVHGAEVSAVYAEGRLQAVRVFNPGESETTVSLPGRRGWLVDLRGRQQDQFEGSFPLRPHGIATAVLAEEWPQM